jgi:molybdenum cofactor biosynthesis protein A
MAKGRYGIAGNGDVCSRSWKEDMGTAPARDLSLDGGAVAGVWTDPQGRCLDYLRLAVTDRCNLRCRYCMPDTGIPAIAPGETLSFAELTRACSVFVGGGVRKIRITGGEPLARKGVIEWMREIAQLDPDLEVLLTTNGVMLEQSLPGLMEAGLRRVNLSLDTLDPDTWKLITRRDGFEAARRSIDVVLEAGLGLKVNVVVQPGVNDHEILDFVALTRDRALAVRFIEPMPFDGAGKALTETIDGQEILLRLRSRFDLTPVSQAADAVDSQFTVRGFTGKVGVIEGHSRTFCSTCSRLRLDSRGRLRTCLYGAPGMNLLHLMRDGGSDDDLIAAIRNEITYRFQDGKKSELAHHLVGLESMASIGG